MEIDKMHRLFLWMMTPIITIVFIILNIVIVLVAFKVSLYLLLLFSLIIPLEAMLVLCFMGLWGLEYE